MNFFAIKEKLLKLMQASQFSRLGLRSIFLPNLILFQTLSYL